MQADTHPIQLALQAWPIIWLIDLLRYLVPTSVIALALALLPNPWRSRRSVQGHAPLGGQRRREFLNSMLTVLIFSANGGLIFAGAQCGILRLYTDITERGWAYAGFSLIVLVLAHDAWFYWTHRLLHQRWLFRWSHRTHHRSVAPTPWAAYSFAPAEAVVQAAFLTLMLLVLPLHPLVIFVFLAHMIIRNVLGHAGVELLPRAWLAGWWGRWLATTLHHDLHHSQGRHNYGLYFTWWDRVGRTEHPQYRLRLRQFVSSLDAPAPLTQSAPSQGLDIVAAVRSSPRAWVSTVAAPHSANAAIAPATARSGQALPVPNTPSAASITAILPKASLREQIQTERMLASPVRYR
jgi:lathosterol oxidase